MEAVLLVGGQGSRLRPLTVHTPKPMLPVAGFPCTAHQIARAREAGVTRIILSTSYQPHVFADYFGDGSAFGVELVTVTEPEPLGTGGAIGFVADELRSGSDEPVLIFNGDILTGLDIPALVHAWREREADVALYLTRVADPRAYGLVPTDAQGWVQEFLEKPTRPEEIVTDQINAGCYVFRRSMIDDIPRGRVVSVERETFPGLLADPTVRMLGVVDEAYWLDLGQPMSYVQGSHDLVTGVAPSPLVEPAGADTATVDAATAEAPTILVDPTAQVSAEAVVEDGTYVGPGVRIEAGAHVSASLLMRDVTIAADAHIHRSALAAGVTVGERVELTETVVGDGATLGAGVQLVSGARVWPHAHVPAGSIRFSSDR